MAFFSRDHGLGSTPGFVLVQGNAELHREATPEFIDEMHAAWPKFLPPIPNSGWKRRAGRAYYDWRVPVRIHVERLTYWASPSATDDGLEVAHPDLPAGGRRAGLSFSDAGYENASRR